MTPGPRIRVRPRCGWVTEEPLYIRYHDEEWGRPVHDDRRLFEFLVLEGAQAGLSWWTVLQKREGYRRAFVGFDPARVARLRPARIEALLQDPCIVRNRAKVTSTVDNARAFLEVQREHGSFDAFAWSFVGGQAHSPAPPVAEGRAGDDGRVGRVQRGAAGPGLSLRRLHHLLRVHAGLRPGGRPRAGLLSRGAPLSGLAAGARRAQRPTNRARNSTAWNSAQKRGRKRLPARNPTWPPPRRAQQLHPRPGDGGGQGLLGDHRIVLGADAEHRASDAVQERPGGGPGVVVVRVAVPVARRGERIVEGAERARPPDAIGGQPRRRVLAELAQAPSAAAS